MTETAEDRIRSLGLSLPAPPKALANYVPAVIANGLLFLSGQVPRSADGTVLVGKTGSDIDTEEACRRARQVGLQILSLVRSELGSLDRVARVVKLTAFIHCTEQYKDQAIVANSCSDLIAMVFADCGMHSRTVVGTSSLPAGTTLEIDAVIAVR
jgi:enamine deaminase RidA (YjgF/YER057c/UK114 family)